MAPFAVGDSLSEMPVFLSPDRDVPAPLDETYESTSAVCPRQVKALIEGPA